MNRFALIMSEVGYTPKTTFWEDFTIADLYGVAAIQDTYNRSFRDWKDNVEYITELTLVLNHKIWQHYGHNEQLANIYDRLWKEVDGWCVENLTGEDAEYFFNVTD
jgi:hypothetical protein